MKDEKLKGRSCGDQNSYSKTKTITGSWGDSPDFSGVFSLSMVPSQGQKCQSHSLSTDIKTSKSTQWNVSLPRAGKNALTSSLVMLTSQISRVQYGDRMEELDFPLVMETLIFRIQPVLHEEKHASHRRQASNPHAKTKLPVYRQLARYPARPPST